MTEREYNSGRCETQQDEAHEPYDKLLDMLAEEEAWERAVYGPTQPHHTHQQPNLGAHRRLLNWQYSHRLF